MTPESEHEDQGAAKDVAENIFFNFSSNYWSIPKALTDDISGKIVSQGFASVFDIAQIASQVSGADEDQKTQTLLKGIGDYYISQQIGSGITGVLSKVGLGKASAFIGGFAGGLTMLPAVYVDSAYSKTSHTIEDGLLNWGDNFSFDLNDGYNAHILDVEDRPFLERALIPGDFIKTILITNEQNSPVALKFQAYQNEIIVDVEQNLFTVIDNSGAAETILLSTSLLDIDHRTTANELKGVMYDHLSVAHDGAQINKILDFLIDTDPIKNDVRSESINIQYDQYGLKAYENAVFFRTEKLDGLKLQNGLEVFVYFDQEDSTQYYLTKNSAGDMWVNYPGQAQLPERATSYHDFVAEDRRIYDKFIAAIEEETALLESEIYDELNLGVSEQSISEVAGFQFSTELEPLPGFELAPPDQSEPDSGSEGSFIISGEAGDDQLGAVINDDLLFVPKPRGAWVDYSNEQLLGYVQGVHSDGRTDLPTDSRIGALGELLDRFEADPSAFQQDGLDVVTDEDSTILIDASGNRWGAVTKIENDDFQHQVAEVVGVGNVSDVVTITNLDPEQDLGVWGPRVELTYPEDFIGQKIGGALGNILAQELADGNVYKSILYSTLLKTSGAHFGTFTDLLGAGNISKDSLFGAVNGVDTAAVEELNSLSESLLKNFSGALTAYVASVAVDEIGDALDLDGYLGDAVDIAANTIVTPVINNAIGTVFENVGLPSIVESQPTIFSGEIDANQLQFQVFSALGRYVGGRLASSVVQPETETAATISTVYTTINTIVSTITIPITGPFAPIAIAVQTFISQVIGTKLGNLFGGYDDPFAVAHIGYNRSSGQYDVTRLSTDDGGDKTIAESMAEAAYNGVNNIITLTGGNFRRTSDIELRIGYEGDRSFVIFKGERTNFDSSGEAIKHAALKLLQNADVVGGHAILMRAWHNSEATTLEAFQEDLLVAEAFQTYLLNPTGVLALMLNEPESEAAQQWAVILQRAAELELHLPHEKDFDGGWGELLAARGNINPEAIPQIEESSIILTDPVTGEETVLQHVIGPGYEIVRIPGTDGNDIIQVNVDGPSISYVTGGPGDDNFVGHDGVDVFLGGDGDDTASGGSGNDWLLGENGDDTLFGEAGDDLLIGGAGDDTLEGGPGYDEIHGGSGNDLIMGNSETDFLYGGTGDDVIHGNEGRLDRIFGDDGDDTLYGQDQDLIYTGRGNDYVQVSGVDNTIHVNRGDGHETVSFSGAPRSTLKFMDDIGANELRFAKQGNDLIITIAGEDQSVTVQNVYGVNYPILNIEVWGQSGRDDWPEFYNYEVLTTYTSQPPPYRHIQIGPHNTPDGPVGSGFVLTGLQTDFHKDYVGATWEVIFGSAAASYNEDSLSRNSPNWVYGGGGNDNLNLGGGNDVGVGGIGSDNIVGGIGDDRLFGGSGDDYLFGEAGRDRLFGGLGDDNLRGRADNDRLFGDVGHDVLHGDGGDDHLEGGTGNDELIGHDGDDILQGGYGDDDLYGDGKKNEIYVGSAKDSVSGGAGDDYLYLGQDDDVGFGEDGNDEIIGGTGNDLVSGGNGNDELSGGDGDDEVVGGEGNDTFHFSAGHDFFADSGAGIDRVVFADTWTARDIWIDGNHLTFLNSETDSIRFDDISLFESFEVADGLALNLAELQAIQNDTLSGTITAELMDGGIGTDTADYSLATSRITVDLEQNTGRYGLAEGDTYASIENIIGGNHRHYHDYLYGDAGDNYIQGLIGFDFIEGGAGADTIDGGEHNDYARYLRSDAGVNVDLERAVQSGGHAEGDILISIEHLYGSAFDDVFRGSDVYNKIYGRNGNDILDSRGGNDRVYGNQGDDTFIYTSGLDTYDEEGSGLDRVVFQTGWRPDDVIIDGNTLILEAGINEISFNDINLFETFVFVGHDEMSFQDLITFHAVDDIFTGDASVQSLDGGDGSDTVDYSASATRVKVDLFAGVGTDGDATGDTFTSIENIIGADVTSGDFIYGDAADNQITALDGNDVLEGGAGADIIHGGAGVDYARYTRSEVGVQVNLELSVFTGGDAEGDALIDIENLTGSAFDDALTGNSSNNILRGENGNDTLNGGLGNDMVYGGRGDDIYEFIGGRDRFYERETGVDRVVFAAAFRPEDAVIDGNVITFDSASSVTFDDITQYEVFSFEGLRDLTLQELIDYEAPATDDPEPTHDSSGDDDTFVGTSSIDAFDGGAGIDTVDYSAATGRVTINLSNGTGTHNEAQGDSYIGIENAIGGSFSHDSLYGTDGVNVLLGMGGGDRLYGSVGADTLDGGAQNDFVYYNASDLAVDVDLLRPVQIGGDAEGDILISIEHFYGSHHDDVFNGTDAYNKIYGHHGDDIIEGRGGDDQIYGNGGDDLLSGGDGADRFIFESTAAANGTDTITDFSLKEGDMLVLSRLLSGYDPLIDLLSDFVEITENGSDSVLKVDESGTGTFGADTQVATLNGASGLGDVQALADKGDLIF